MTTKEQLIKELTEQEVLREVLIVLRNNGISFDVFDQIEKRVEALNDN